MTIVQVKWQKQKFSVNIDKTQPIRVFQEELYRLTVSHILVPISCNVSPSKFLQNDKLF